MDRSLCKKIPVNSIKIFGSGGSRTIIILTPNNRVYKYFIIFKNKDTDTKDSVKESLQKYQTEINIQKELTKNIVKKNISPHIVQYIDSLYCNLKPLFLFTKCPSYKKILLTKYNSKKRVSPECSYLLRGHPVFVKKGFLIEEMEYCQYGLGKIIKTSMRKSNKTLEYNLNRVLFQILYTLATIQKKYPDFVHHDLFMRNVLVTENSASKNEYIRYYFGKKYVFDVPANGFMCKISDFGLSNLNKKIHDTLKVVKSPHEDVFNIIYDIYNGGNLGAESCMSIAEKRKNKKKIKFLDKYFSKFINIEIIKFIKKKDNDHMLSRDWKKFYDPELSKLLKVKNASEYLKYFSKIYPIHKDHKIIHTYGI